MLSPGRRLSLPFGSKACRFPDSITKVSFLVGMDVTGGPLPAGEPTIHDGHGAICLARREDLLYLTPSHHGLGIGSQGLSSLHSLIGD